MVDVGVRVFSKTVLEGPFESADPAAGLGDDLGQGCDSRPVGVGDRVSCVEVGASEALLYAAGSLVDAALPSASFQRSPDLGQRQAGADTWCGRPAQDGYSVAMGQVPERFEGTG